MNEIATELKDLISNRLSLMSTAFDIINDVTDNEDTTRKIMATTLGMTMSSWISKVSCLFTFLTN